MYKNQILSSLNKIANNLDKSGIFEEANKITNIMLKIAQSENEENPEYVNYLKNTTKNIINYPIWNVFLFRKILIKKIKQRSGN